MDLADLRDLNLKRHTTCWKSPANIAFVKYWGKKGHQLPANPSLSMTLKECVTQTKVEFFPSDRLEVILFLDGAKEDKFAQKIYSFMESLSVELPWVLNLKVSIETSNTFPHGAGIASSASGLSAFALNLMDYAFHLADKKLSDDDFFKKASYVSRLGSGSACRSVFGGYTSWGESELYGSSDLFATPLDVHAQFKDLHDTVLVISDAEKSISSRHGHDRMNEHAYASARFAQARCNYSKMLSALRLGDLEVMGSVLENEALSLHAMMLTSPAAFTLLKANTISAIELIWDFRNQTKLPLYFTLDAGPNLHLIYPETNKNKIQTFISHELAPLSIKTIDDQRGEGPARC